MVLACLVHWGKLGNHTVRVLSNKGERGGRRMTKSEKDVIACAHAALANNPAAKQPDEGFIRDWAYGNAGLEDERITIEQVEDVLRRRREQTA